MTLPTWCVCGKASFREYCRTVVNDRFWPEAVIQKCQQPTIIDFIGCATSRSEQVGGWVKHGKARSSP